MAQKPLAASPALPSPTPPSARPQSVDVGNGPPTSVDRQRLRIRFQTEDSVGPHIRKRPPQPSVDWEKHITYIGGTKVEEDKALQKFAGEHAAIQRAIGTQIGKIHRGQHAAAHAAVKLTMTIDRSLPQFAKYGIFQPGARYEGVGRFSSTASVPSPAEEPDFRGFAMSIAGPGGIQDFLTVTPNFFFKDATETMWMVRASVARGQVLAQTKNATQADAAFLKILVDNLGADRAHALIRQVAEEKARSMTSLATQHYYSNMPIKIGPYTAKVRLVPSKTDSPKPHQGPAPLKNELKDRLKNKEVTFDFELQFYQNERTTPFEDMSKPWTAPFVKVGRITISKQDLDSPESRELARKVDETSFSPAHTQHHEAPNGIGRARAVIYEKSAETRGGCPYGF